MTLVERALAARIAADHNATRADLGLAPLHEYSALAPYAGANGEQMELTQQLGHSDVTTLLDDFPHNQWVAENALVMFDPATEAVNVWSASPPHRANLTAARATHLWVDVRCAVDGRMWVTAQYVERPLADGDALPGTDPAVTEAAPIDLRCPIGVGPFASGEAFVAQQYRDFLGRQPDDDGLAYWTVQLNSRRMTAPEVVLQFLNSPEFAGRIRPHAEAALLTSDRFPTVEEVDAWRQAPRPQALVRADIAGIRSRVDVLMIYVGMLGRTPDEAGFEYWTGVADRGASLNVLVSGFLASPEYRNRITG